MEAYRAFVCLNFILSSHFVHAVLENTFSFAKYLKRAKFRPNKIYPLYGIVNVMFT